MAGGVLGVRLVERVEARKSGPNYYVDMHLHVDPDMTVRDAHSLARRVRAEVCRQLPQVLDVLIHIEPDEPDPIADAYRNAKNP